VLGREIYHIRLLLAHTFASCYSSYPSVYYTTGLIELCWRVMSKADEQVGLTAHHGPRLVRGDVVLRIVHVWHLSKWLLLAPCGLLDGSPLSRCRPIASMTTQTR
jgi:hypothetical protein